MKKDQAEGFVLVLETQALGEKFWSLHYMDPPGQKMSDPSIWTLIPTPPSIQHPARYVEARTIGQNTVQEAGGGNQKIRVRSPPEKMRL